MSTPAPVKQVSGRTIALVAAAIAAVGVLIIGLVVGLSSDDRSAADDAGATELTVNSYGLPYRAAISLHVPTDWYVIEDPTDPEWFWLVHSAEPVTYDDFAAYIADPPSWPTAESIRFVVLSCPTTEDYSDRDFDADLDQWQPWEPSETDTMLGRQARSRSAIRIVGANVCLEAVAVDSAALGRSLPTGAQHFLAQLLAGEISLDVTLIPKPGATSSR